MNNYKSKNKLQMQKSNIKNNNLKKQRKKKDN